MSEWIRIRVKDFYKDAVEELPMMSKEEVADALLDRIMKARQ